jgi:hypothetical protein
MKLKTSYILYRVRENMDSTTSGGIVPVLSRYDPGGGPWGLKERLLDKINQNFLNCLL